MIVVLFLYTCFMFNPLRRNRNIGTKKQGHGQANKLTIPRSPDLKGFYERLGNYTKHEVAINGNELLFVVEETRSDSQHACSIEDITTLIEHITPEDCKGLKFIILRQPKRKENILSPVWGRLMYSYEFEKNYGPAIILEAADYTKPLKWARSLALNDQKEINRLKEDGHPFVDDGRSLTAELTPEHVRNTQLYRSLPHEIGHYVHYLTVVERPGNEDEGYDAWDQRWGLYRSIPASEREEFAHRYATQLKNKLTEMQIIPFTTKIRESHSDTENP